MCNYKHDDDSVKPIRKTGKGWKIFSISKHVIDGKRLLHACVSANHYINSQNGFFMWIDNDKHVYGDGFCFLLDKKTAKQALKLWNEDSSCCNNVILPITYIGGIEQHMEDSFVNKLLRVGLCKGFKVDPKDMEGYTW